MTAPPPPADPATVRFLPEAVAELLGVGVEAVVGRPLSLAFRVLPVAGRGLFVSGLETDAAELAVRAHGATLVAVEADGALPGAGAVGVITEQWSAPGPGAIGTGPVAWTGTDPPPDATIRWCTITRGSEPDPDRLGAVTTLRQELARAADRLERQVAPSVDWALLAAVEPPGLEWLRCSLDHMARSRRAVGSYLIDVADDIDDERLDQLGDGYVRASELWRALARTGGAARLGPEIHELERSCVTWMRGAADRPTRYAF